MNSPRRPGGIAVLAIPNDTTRASFGGDAVAPVNENGQKYAVVGIGLSQKIGKARICTGP